MDSKRDKSHVKKTPKFCKAGGKIFEDIADI